MPQNLSKQKITLSLFAGFVFMFMVSCQYEFIVPEEVIIPDTISFSEDVIPIFNAKCNNGGCHAAGFGILDLSPANAWEDLFRKNQIDVDNPAQSPLYIKLTASGSTHQGRSTAQEQATILEWINKGAQNN